MAPPSMAPVTPWRRDVISDAQSSLSSWDGCMAQSYCKWPVIVGIVVGSLIVISIIWCIVRCACCGLSCCCGFCSCCNACCPGPRKKQGHKEIDTGPPPHPVNTPYASHPQASYHQPQFATFDAPSGRGQNHNDDALPAMPSWNQAHVGKVEEVVPAKQEDTELSRLNPNGYSDSAHPSTTVLTAGTAYTTPSPTRVSPPERSPSQDTYGFPGQRPSPGPGQMAMQPQRSPSQDTYGYAAQRLSPRPYGNGPSRSFDSHQGGQESGVYRQNTPDAYNAPQGPGLAPYRQGSPYRQSPSPRPMQGQSPYQSYSTPQERYYASTPTHGQDASLLGGRETASGGYGRGGPQQPPPQPAQSPYQAYRPNDESRPGPGSWREI